MSSNGQSKSIYLDPNQPAKRRIEDLLSRMTLEEKVKQMTQLPGDPSVLEEGKFSLGKAKKSIGEAGIGSLYCVFRSLNPEQAAETANEIQKFAIKNTRLGIPILLGEECLHGHKGQGATVFPHAIAMASTWNPDLIQEISSAIAEETRAMGGHQTYSPVLGVVRDLRWGRTQETFGEDPYMVTCMGLAMVRGLQGENMDKDNAIMATLKHFPGSGDPLCGLDKSSLDIPARTLSQINLPPFEAAIKAGAGSVMSCHNSWNGVPVTASKKMLTEILREKLGFDGFIISDMRPIEKLVSHFHTASTYKEGVWQATNAGIDMFMNELDVPDALLELVKEGRISEERIGESVRRILKAKFLLGLFDHPYVDLESAGKICNSSEHRKLALQVALESMTLLKNENNLLPLDKNIGSIMVSGPNADNIPNQLGNYSGSAPTVTILEGIKNKVSSKTRVCYAKGCETTSTSAKDIKEAVKLAKKSDAAVVVLGDSLSLVGENICRYTLNLPKAQRQLIKAIYETKTPLVVVLINARATAIGWIADNVPAILETWCPGEEGGNAVAGVLFGNYNPAGKLPITIPRSTAQLPIWYSRIPTVHSWNMYEPLFPFGHGLSYTKFEYGNLSVNPERIGPAGKAKISLEVKNIGNRKGDEIVQLYINDVMSSMITPIKELKGFKRITLEPGKKKKVNFTLTEKELSFINSYGQRVVESGTFEVMIGSSFEDIRLTGSFEVC